MAILTDYVESVLKKTVERRLDWEELSGTRFVAQFEPYTLEVGLARNSVYLWLRDGNGNVLAEVAERKVEVTLAQALAELYENARRIALRVDDALASIGRQLEQL